MRAALILGPDTIVRAWTFQALSMAIDNGLEITTVLHCTNDERPPLKAKHAGYYALAILGRRRMMMSQSTDISSLLPPDVDVIRFESEWEGAWQRIPDETRAKLQGVDVIVKFGMNLLKDPDDLPVKHGVLSYHHGDPELHRGRPAGFYELSAGEATMGVIVQKLSNTLDGGQILAKAYSRVFPTSYSKTLNHARANGIPLLARSLKVLEAGGSLPNSRLGPNHRLPSNELVLKTTIKMLKARVRRGLYGAFREKRWKIAFLPGEVDPERAVVPNAADLQPIPLPKGYTFAADPCAFHKGRLFAEIMNARTGKGEIAVYADDAWHPLNLPVGGGHLSYPQIIEYEKTTYLFPEMARVGPPSLFALDDEQLACKSVQPLIGLEHERLIDGTLLSHAGHWYLFAGRPGTGDAQLDLWNADRPTGPWRHHPRSPINIDPRAARMAGPIVQANGRMYRMGQNGSVGYGQGVTINRIMKLSPTEYEESHIGSLTIDGAFGPHTVLATDQGYWLDFYTDKTTPLAGVRRLIGRLK